MIEETIVENEGTPRKLTSRLALGASYSGGLLRRGATGRRCVYFHSTQLPSRRTDTEEVRAAFVR